MLDKIMAAMEHGRPDAIPIQFAMYFREKEMETERAATAAMQGFIQIVIISFIHIKVRFDSISDHN